MAKRPIDAASLVLVRRVAGECQVLMGRRAPGHRFLPDVYVFPGGRVDRGDHRVVAGAALRESTHRALSDVCSRARAHALAVAAVRETWEETGLVLGELHDNGLRPALERLDYIARAITPRDFPIRFHARFFMADAAYAGGALRGNGELLDLGWRPLAACLALPVADITEFVLGEVGRRIDAAPAATAVPVFSYRGGRVTVR